MQLFGVRGPVTALVFCDLSQPTFVDLVRNLVPTPKRVGAADQSGDRSPHSKKLAGRSNY
jgi:hypothetical protein